MYYIHDFTEFILTNLTNIYAKLNSALSDIFLVMSMRQTPFQESEDENYLKYCFMLFLFTLYTSLLSFGAKAIFKKKCINSLFQTLFSSVLNTKAISRSIILVNVMVLKSGDSLACYGLVFYKLPKGESITYWPEEHTSI